MVWETVWQCRLWSFTGKMFKIVRERGQCKMTDWAYPALGSSAKRAALREGGILPPPPLTHEAAAVEVGDAAIETFNEHL